MNPICWWNVFLFFNAATSIIITLLHLITRLHTLEILPVAGQHIQGFPWFSSVLLLILTCQLQSTFRCVLYCSGIRALTWANWLPNTAVSLLLEFHHTALFQVQNSTKFKIRPIFLSYFILCTFIPLSVT